jgi:hypothetical protein
LLLPKRCRGGKSKRCGALEITRFSTCAHDLGFKPGSPEALENQATWVVEVSRDRPGSHLESIGEFALFRPRFGYTVGF